MSTSSEETDIDEYFKKSKAAHAAKKCPLANANEVNARSQRAMSVTGVPAVSSSSVWMKLVDPEALKELRGDVERTLDSSEEDIIMYLKRSANWRFDNLLGADSVVSRDCDGGE